MKRTSKQRLNDIKSELSQAAEKLGDVAEDKFEDAKNAIKRGKDKLQS